MPSHPTSVAVVATVLLAACSENATTTTPTASTAAPASATLSLTSTGPVVFAEGSVTVLEARNAVDDTLTRRYAWRGAFDAEQDLFTTGLETNIAPGTYDVVTWQFICDIDTPCHGEGGELDRHIDAGLTDAERGPTCELQVDLAPASSTALAARWDIDGCVSFDLVQPGSAAVERLDAAFEVEVSYEETGTTFCPVLATQFVDRSTGRPDSWRWAFPDGSSSTEQNPRLRNAVSGDVTLTVTRGSESASTTEFVTHIEC